MTAAVRELIATTLKSAAKIDPTLTADRQAAALDALEGRGAATADGKKRDAVLTRAEVAARLKCSVKTVSRYAERGIIRPIRLGAKSRRASNGYSALSVEEAIEKGTAKAIEKGTAAALERATA